MTAELVIYLPVLLDELHFFDINIHLIKTANRRLVTNELPFQLIALVDVPIIPSVIQR